MAPRQHFLPWDQCPLTQTVEWLVRTHGSGPWLDLSGLLLVSNSSHANFRLQEKLVERCEQDSLVYTPATFLTVGQLPEQLYQPQRPFANSIAQRLMWVRALRNMSNDQLQAVLPNPPGPEEIARWLTIVQSLRELHHEMASEMKRFFSGRDAAAKLSDPLENQRWEFLVKAQSLYWEELNRAELWDRQTARMIAVDHKECSTDKQIVMVGTVDLSQVLRAMLLQVASQVTILTFAGAGFESLFDSLGCLEIDAWCDRHIDVPQNCLRVVDTPEEQAREVRAFLAELGGEFRADEITIGVPDDGVVPYLESEFEAVGVPMRYARGPALLESSFFRLVQAIGDFSASRDYVDFASVVRHPEIGRLASDHGLPNRWLPLLDQWYERHLPSDLYRSNELPGLSNQRFGVLKDVIQLVLSKLQPLLEQPVAALNQWPERWNTVLNELLAGKEVHSQDPHDRGWIQSLRHFSRVLNQFQELSDDWVVEVHCVDFLRMVFSELKGNYLAPAPDSQAVSLLGWLDTPLDDAAVTIVTSFNEGLIPSSDPAHPFLNQSLRQQLQLLDNRRRYARDAYALELLIHSRTHYRLLVGRENSAGEPRTPSRLLMAMPTDDLPQRADFLFGESEPKPVADTDSEKGRSLEIPQPERLADPPDTLRVTDFKSYLSCPFRFYLTRILKLRSVDDQVEELGGGHFGDLLHNVLENFGKCDLRDSEDSEEIRLFLEAELESQAKRSFGRDLRASMRLQLTQAKLRLARFADAQAAHRRDGWRISHLEQEAKFTLVVDQNPVTIVGRIDRIDIHQEDGRWLVLDYKTSDHFQSLDKLYFKSRDNEWVDLQLPLYQRLVEAIPESHGKSISLGVVSLPRKLDDVRFHIAAWDDQKLRSAFDLAESVVRKILNQEFLPMSEQPGYDPGIERICQTGVLKLD